MDTLAIDPPFDDGSPSPESTDERLPRRPRRKLLNRASAALLALVTCAVGFYVGVRVEKGHIASTPQTISGAAAAAGAGRGAAAGRGGAAGAAGATGAAGAARGASGAGAAGGAGFAGAAARGGAGGAGGGSFGTVASVNGSTIVLTEASGNTVKVKLNGSTTISKTESVKKGAIHPGDTVIVSGVAGKSGTISAATVTDSGAGRSTGSGSGSGSGASGGSGSIGSLFSGG